MLYVQYTEGLRVETVPEATGASLDASVAPSWSQEREEAEAGIREHPRYLPPAALHVDIHTGVLYEVNDEHESSHQILIGDVESFMVNDLYLYMYQTDLYDA